MNQHYHQHYKTLGIRPGDSWPRLRRAYKRAMRTWHPDRYPDNHAQKHEAEEITKAINQAYGELADYYRIHGTLPFDHSTPPSEQETIQHPGSTYTATATPSSPPEASHDQTPQMRRSSRLISWSLLAVGLAGIVLLWQAPVDPHAPAPAPVISETTPGNPTPTATPADKSENRFFTVGSPLGEVYSTQGVPNKIENGVWHYGEARVYFINGHVAKWEDPSGNVLKAQTQLVESPKTHAPEFSKGSSKAEVRAAQGTPMQESERTWDYGPSRVYFEGDHVSGWHESPLQPLKLRR